jgi:tubulin polyglutamylase TTLL6/13
VRLDASLGSRGSRCFEVLGLDIMIDSNLNPWMIEVNHLPR